MSRTTWHVTYESINGLMESKFDSVEWTCYDSSNEDGSGPFVADKKDRTKRIIIPYNSCKKIEKDISHD